MKWVHPCIDLASTMIKHKRQPVRSLSPRCSWIGNCCFENGNYHSSQPPHWLWHWPCQGPGPTVSALSSPHYLQPLTLRGNYSDNLMNNLRLSVSLHTETGTCTALSCLAEDDMTIFSPDHSPLCSLHSAGHSWLWLGWLALTGLLPHQSVYLSLYLEPEPESTSQAQADHSRPIRAQSPDLAANQKL